MFSFRHTSSLFPYISPLISRRGLQTHAKPRPEVVLANNSGLFFTYAALVAPNGRIQHPAVTCFVPPFWIDAALADHSDHDTLHWGQTLDGFPLFIQKLFLNIYPYQDKQSYVTWRQYKELRDHLLSELRALNVTIHRDIPRIQVLDDASGFILTTADSTLKTGADTYFYNLYRVPKHENNTEIGEIISHTNLYKLTREKRPKKVIITGGGRSAVWLGKHFPDIEFIAISNMTEIPTFSGEILSSNISFFYNGKKAISDIDPRYRGIYHGGMIASAQPGHGTVNIIDKHHQVINFTGLPYSATGLILNKQLTQHIPQDRVMLHPQAYDISREWVAPQEITSGSLMEVTKAWALLTRQFEWTAQTYCFHEGSFTKAFTTAMKEASVELPMDFFHNLRKRILKERLLNKADTIAIFRDCFLCNVHHDAGEKQLQRFNEVVEHIYEHGIRMDESEIPSYQPGGLYA